MLYKSAQEFITPVMVDHEGDDEGKEEHASVAVQAPRGRERAYRVDLVLRANGVRDEEPHDFDGAESRIAHAIQYSRDIVCGERNKVRRRGLRIVRATGKKVHLWRSVAVRRADSPGELDAGWWKAEETLGSGQVRGCRRRDAQVTERDVVFDGEGALKLHDVVETQIFGEAEFDVRVCHDGAI